MKQILFALLLFTAPAVASTMEASIMIVSPSPTGPAMDPDAVPVETEDGSIAY